MRKFACLLGALIVASMSLSAVAQTKTSDKDSSKWSVFGGYSYLHYSNGTDTALYGSGEPNITANGNGFVVSAAYSLTHMFAVVGEYGFYHASSVSAFGPGVTANMQTYLFGLKASFASRGPIKPLPRY